MINLNDSKFATTVSKRFNNGKAGIAQGVTVELKKYKEDEKGYHVSKWFDLVYTDKNGAIITDWVNFIDESIDQDSPNAWMPEKLITKLVAIVKAALGDDYKFPDGLNTYTKAANFLVKTIKDQVGATEFNLAVHFGTQKKPNKNGYLEVKGMKFIEKHVPGETPNIELWRTDLKEPNVEKPNDILSSGADTAAEGDDDFAF